MPRRTDRNKAHGPQGRDAEAKEHGEECASTVRGAWKLAPCPRCGGEGREVGNYLTAMICSIYCKRCGWHVTGMADTIAKCREEALKAWAEPAADNAAGAAPEGAAKGDQEAWRKTWASESAGHAVGSGISGAGGLLDED